MNWKNIIAWVFQVAAAFILAQSLFFKFSAAPESVAIFSSLGMEPWGRILIGLLELLAVIMLLVPRLAASGAFLAGGIMLGAVIGHLTTLGIEVQGDGGLLFGLSLVVLLSSFIVVCIRREHLPIFGKMMK